MIDVIPESAEMVHSHEKNRLISHFKEAMVSPFHLFGKLLRLCETPMASIFVPSPCISGEVREPVR